MDPAAQKEKIKKEAIALGSELYQIGQRVDFEIMEIRDGRLIFGSIVTNEGKQNHRGFINVSDLSMSMILRNTILSELRVGQTLSDLIVDSTSRGIKLTNLEITKKSIKLDQLRYFT